MANKDVHGFQNEIENLDIIRRMLRLIYMYGAYSLTDMAESGILPVKIRAIRDHYKRLENYLNSKEFNSDEHLSNHTLPDHNTDKRGRRIIVDPFKCSYNFLASIYRQHTITRSDILFYFYFLTAINSENFDSSCFSAIDLISEMENIFEINTKTVAENEEQDVQIPEQFMSPEQFSAKLAELVKLGIIGENQDNTFFIPENILNDEIVDNTSHDTYDDVLQSLRLMSEFFYNHCPISIPGFLLSEKIQQIRLHEYWESAEENNSFRIKQSDNPFLIENSRYQNIMDDDIAYTILEAIAKRTDISYSYQAETYSDSKVFSLAPIKILDDLYYGRHYVYGWSYTTDEYVLHRLDRIFDLVTNVSVSTDRRHHFKEAECSYETLEATYQKQLANGWNLPSFGKNTQSVLIHFIFTDSPDNDYLYQYFIASAKNGKTICVDEKQRKYDFHVTLSNPVELVPWINSFGNCAFVDNDVNPAFYTHMKKYNEEWLKIYAPV